MRSGRSEVRAWADGWRGDRFAAMTEDEFIAAILRNPLNGEILRRLPALGLPDCWLVAGCLYQAVWNLKSGRPPDADVKDYDVFYFDSADLSYEAEDRAIRAAERLFADLAAQGAVVEVRNQARVHLWYEGKFGVPYAPLSSATDGISRFLVAGTCVGVQPDARGGIARLFAPYGLEEMEQGLLRPCPLLRNPARYAEKVASYKARWPWLREAAACTRPE